MEYLDELSIYLDNLPREELNVFALEALSIYIGNSLIANGFITESDYLATINDILFKIKKLKHLKIDAFKKSSDYVKHELYDSLPIEIRKIFDEDSIYGYYKLWEQTRSEEYNIIIDTLLDLSAGSSDEFYTQFMFVDLFDYFLLFYNNKQGRDIETQDVLMQNGGGSHLSFIAVIAIFLTSFLHFNTSFFIPRLPIKRRAVEPATSNTVNYETGTEIEPDSVVSISKPLVNKPKKGAKTSRFLRTASEWFKHKSLYDNNELTHIISQALPVISKSLDVDNCNFLLDCIENTLNCCNNIITNGTKLLGIYNERFSNMTEMINDWGNKVRFVKDLLNKTEERIGYKLLTFVGSIVTKGITIPSLRLKNFKKNIIDKVQPPRSIFTRVLTTLIKLADNPRSRKSLNDFFEEQKQRGGNRKTRKSKLQV